MKSKTPKPDGNRIGIRQERFAEYVAGGLSATKAYIQAGYKVSEKVAGTNGPRLLGNAVIAAKVAELRERQSAKQEFTREKLVQHLVAVITTPVGEVDASSPLSQEVTSVAVTIGKGKTARTEIRTRVKMQGKLESARLLCEMMGWKEPVQIVLEAGPKTLEALEARALAVVSALDRNAKAS